MDHLVFVVHGVGPVHDLSFRSIVDCGVCCVCVRACVCACVHTCVHACIRVCTHVCVYTTLHVCNCESESNIHAMPPPVDDFREVSQLMLQTHKFRGQAPCDGDDGGRTEYLPVHWHAALHCEVKGEGVNK